METGNMNKNEDNTNRSKMNLIESENIKLNKHLEERGN